MGREQCLCQGRDRGGALGGKGGAGARSDGGAGGIRGGCRARQHGEAQGGVGGTVTGGTGTVPFRYDDIIPPGVPRPFSVFRCGTPRLNAYTIPSYTIRYSPPPDAPPDAASPQNAPYPPYLPPGAPSTTTSARHPPSRPTAARRPPTPGGICNPTGPGPARSVRARSTPPAPAAAPNPARPGGIRLQPAHRVTRSLRPTLPTRPRPPEPDAMWDGCRAQHEPIMPTPCLSARLPPDHTTSARADRPTVKPAHLHPPSASSDLHLTP